MLVARGDEETQQRHLKGPNLSAEFDGGLIYDRFCVSGASITAGLLCPEPQALWCTSPILP